MDLGHGVCVAACILSLSNNYMFLYVVYTCTVQCVMAAYLTWAYSYDVYVINYKLHALCYLGRLPS